MNIIKISSKSRPVKPNTKCQVAGWGQTKTKNKTNDLRVADVSIIDIRICKKEWENKNTGLPANVLCAGGYRTKSGACQVESQRLSLHIFLEQWDWSKTLVLFVLFWQGDSGGPLVCSGLAVGIVSFNHNHNCTYPNVPNVYTEISAYIDWIKKMIKIDA